MSQIDFTQWTPEELDDLAGQMARFKADDICGLGMREISTWIAEDAYCGRTGYKDMNTGDLEEEVKLWLEYEYLSAEDFERGDTDLWDVSPELAAVVFFILRHGSDER